jgi:hypothetical protein
MLDLFVSGHDEIYFEKDPLNPSREVINTNKSWKARGAYPGDLDTTTGFPFAYVPDPPCIMPYEEDTEMARRARGDMTHENPKVDDYWKEHAGFLDCWPQLKDYRETQDAFRTFWMNRPTDSRVRSYINMSKFSIGVRNRPTHEEHHKNDQIIRPGQCIAVEMVEERGELDDSISRWLKLPGPGAGWVMESTRSGEPLMAELKNIEAGLWWYKCCSKCPVEARKCPSWDDSVRAGYLVNPKEIMVINLRCQVNGYMFLHLYDGRGWVFELKPGTLKNDRNPESIVMMPCEDDFINGEEMEILKQLVPPTNEVVELGLWTYLVNLDPVLAIGTKRNGYFLAPGTVVKVDKRANSNGLPNRLGSISLQNRVWLRLADGSGWVPETDDSGKRLMLLQSSDEVVYPSWFRPGADPNKQEDWMTGVV